MIYLMEFREVLSILDSILRKKSGAEEANRFLVEFMKRSVATGIITITVANEYLTPYGCSINKCWGCTEKQLNQLAHMSPDGCLYDSD